MESSFESTSWFDQSSYLDDPTTSSMFLKDEDVGKRAQETAKAPADNKKEVTFDEYHKLCVKDFLWERFTFAQLIKLMELYDKENSPKVKFILKSERKSWNAAKVMTKKLFMFHILFQEVNKNLMIERIYFEKMSDLLAQYIDLELKASLYNSDSETSISGRITTMLKKYFGSYHEFQLGCLLKVRNICEPFNEICHLIISRVVRDLQPTQFSEVSYIRAILVFKLWMNMTKNGEERRKIKKLANHLAQPPDWLVENPSQFTIDVFPRFFQKSKLGLTDCLLMVPWQVRKSIKKFLEYTRIKATIERPADCDSTKHSDNTLTEEQRTDECRVIEEIQFDLREIIISEEKISKGIEALHQSHYKYTTVKDITGSLESIDCTSRVCNVKDGLDTKDEATQTEQDKCSEMRETKKTNIDKTSKKDSSVITKGVETNDIIILDDDLPSSKEVNTSQANENNVPGKMGNLISVRSPASLLKRPQIIPPDCDPKNWHIPEIMNSMSNGPIQQPKGRPSVNVMSMDSNIAQKNYMHFSQITYHGNYPCTQGPNESTNNSLIRTPELYFDPTLENELHFPTQNPSLSTDAPSMPRCVTATANKVPNQSVSDPSQIRYQSRYIYNGRHFIEQMPYPFQENNVPPAASPVVPTSHYMNYRHPCIRPSKAPEGLMPPYGNVLTNNPLSRPPTLEVLNPQSYNTIRPRLNASSLPCPNRNFSNVVHSMSPERGLAQPGLTSPVPNALPNLMDNIPISELQRLQNMSLVHSAIQYKEQLAANSVPNSRKPKRTSNCNKESNSNENQFDNNAEGLRLPPYSSIRKGKPTIEIPSILSLTCDEIPQFIDVNDNHSTEPVCVASSHESLTSSETSNVITESHILRAMALLTHNNLFGYIEYKFEKMPISADLFKDILFTHGADINNSSTLSNLTLDDVIVSFCQANEIFFNECNTAPPQLLKVNNVDIYKNKVNMGPELSKRHMVTLKKDRLLFIEQEKFRNFILESRESLQDNLIFNYNERCLCLQCSVNNIILQVNSRILMKYRLYKITKEKASSNILEHTEGRSNQLSEPQNLKRSAVEGADTPQPSKKNKSVTPPSTIGSDKEAEISYPSTLMMSIAQLEPLQNSLTKNRDITVTLVPSTSGTTEDPSRTSASEIVPYMVPIYQNTKNRYPITSNSQTGMASSGVINSGGRRKNQSKKPAKK